MSAASSSSASIVRCLARPGVGGRLAGKLRRRDQVRTYAAPAFAEAPSQHTLNPGVSDGRPPTPAFGRSRNDNHNSDRSRPPPPSSFRNPSSSSSSSSGINRFVSASPTSGSSTTPQIATDYLSHLLRLPASKAFPPELALQILTHKSYRYAHVIRHSSPLIRRKPSFSDRTAEAEERDPDLALASLEQSASPHNSRLSFLGRRAIASYLALFIHSAIPSSSILRDVDFLRGRSLEAKLEALRHVNNLGREVGERWEVDSVMRWDRNETGADSSHIKIKGLTVEAILGGLFAHHGSPAAQRAFHLMVLPHLSEQFRDPMLREKVEVMRQSVEGVVLP